MRLGRSVFLFIPVKYLELKAQTDTLRLVYKRLPSGDDWLIVLKTVHIYLCIIMFYLYISCNISLVVYRTSGRQMMNVQQQLAEVQELQLLLQSWTCRSYSPHPKVVEIKFLKFHS